MDFLSALVAFVLPTAMIAFAIGRLRAAFPPMSPARDAQFRASCRAHSVCQNCLSPVLRTSLDPQDPPRDILSCAACTAD